MPKITSTDRPTPVSEENFHQPRRTIRVSTGIEPPRGMAARAPAAPVASAPTSAVVQAPVGQPAIGEAPPASAVTLSPQLTALARQQARLQKEIQAQRDKEAAWEREKAGFIPRDSIKAKLQQNAAEALQEAVGMSYEELTNLLVAQQNGNDPVQKLTAEVEQLKKSQEESANKQFDAIVKQYKAEAKALVTKDAQKFAFLEANPEWIDGAVQHIVDEWEADPDNVVSLEDALALAEETLRDDAKKTAAVLAKIEKPAPQTPSEPPAPQAPSGRRLPPPPQTSQAPRTLSRSMDAEPQQPAYGQFQHMSLKERIAEATRRASR